MKNKEVKSKAKKKISCPECGSNNLEKEICGNNIQPYMALVCQDCGEEKDEMTEEQQIQLLEAIGKRNDAIESFGESFGEGMKKLDEHADGMMERMKGIKKQARKLNKRLKQILILLGLHWMGFNIWLFIKIWLVNYKRNDF